MYATKSVTHNVFMVFREEVIKASRDKKMEAPRHDKTVQTLDL